MGVVGVWTTTHHDQGKVLCLRRRPSANIVLQSDDPVGKIHSAISCCHPLKAGKGPFWLWKVDDDSPTHLMEFTWSFFTSSSSSLGVYNCINLCSSWYLDCVESNFITYSEQRTGEGLTWDSAKKRRWYPWVDRYKYTVRSIVPFWTISEDSRAL